jgi:F-type H+-transporting ATPase subunit O
MQGARGLAQAAQKEVKLPPQHGVPGRYAAALYMAAVKTDSLQKVESELSQVASLLNESKDFHNFVADPSVPRHVKVDGLNSVLSKMGASDVTKNFIGGPPLMRLHRAAVLSACAGSVGVS